MLFRGTNKLTLDVKGRMVMPTRYRERLQELCGGRLVVTVDRDRCLLIYPLPDWEMCIRDSANCAPRRGICARRPSISTLSAWRPRSTRLSSE